MKKHDVLGRERTQWQRIRAGALGVALLASTMVAVALVVPDAEAAFDEAVYPTWGVGGVDESTSQNYRAEVWDFQQIGDVMYVGGKFLEVKESYSSPGYPQSYLAAFDVHTGDWLQSFSPTLNGPVYTLDVSPSGNLIAGGEFTSVNGASGTGGLVTLDATGGVVAGFKAHISRIWSTNTPVVRDMSIDGNWLYAVGNFSHVEGPDGQRHQFRKAVRVNVETGLPDTSWTPSLDGRSGWGVTVSDDGQRVHLAGYFTSVNGTPGTALMASVDAVTGALTPGWEHGPRDFWIFHDVEVFGDRLYAGGAEHAFYILDSTTGALIEKVYTPHDTQVVERIGDKIYIGCHCRSNGQWLYEVDGATGTISTDFTLAASAGEGAWSVGAASDGCLWIGGDFKSAAMQGADPATYQWVGGFMRVCDEAGPNPGESNPLPASTDTTAPTMPLGVTGTYQVGPAVQLSWTPSTDDVGVRRYTIWRDGQVVGTSDVASYTDELIPANGTYSYAVTASDAAWNTSAPSAVIDVGISSVVGGDAIQTTTAGEQTPERALDGDLNGAGSSGSVSRTTSAGWPYWELDAGSVSTITSVRLWGGTDYSYRTQNVYVFVSDLPFPSELTPDLIADTSIYRAYFGGTLDRGVRADVNVEGRYIRVATAQGRQVQLAEVQVETEPTGVVAPPSPDTQAPSAVGSLEATFDDETSTVSLDWIRATDNRAVSNYVITRDGDVIGMSSLPLFNDAPNGEGIVTYGVRAVDAAGNQGPLVETQVFVSGPQLGYVAFGDSWRYLNTGELPQGWTSAAFDDSGWASGETPMGFGNGGEATVLNDGNVVNLFRTTFDATDTSQVEQLLVQARRDDGIIVYLNGTEIWRDNVSGNGFADSSVWGSAESSVVSAFVSAAPLVPGTNTLAVSIHQGGARSGGDLSFNLALAAEIGDPDLTAPPAPGAPTAVVEADNAVTLDWPAVVDDRTAVRYTVWRDGVSIAETTQTNYIDAATSAGATYTYEVSASDVAGNQSGTSPAVAVAIPGPEPDALVPPNAIWSYLDAGVAPGSGWTTVGFDDAGWSSGTAQFGFGDGDETTVVANGGIAAAFRHEFSVADASAVASLDLDLIRDDGAVVYLNGVEVLRDNMPDGNIGVATRAAVSVWGSGESSPVTHNLSAAALVDGTNVLAVSIHNAGPWSGDLSFAATVRAVPGVQPPPPVVDEVFVGQTATWRYLNNGVDPDPAWAGLDFDDGSWATGTGEFGFGDGDEATMLAPGVVTAYLRTSFVVDNPAAFGELTLSLVRDDGAAVYLNGAEVVRTNLPAGPLSAGTYANAAAWGADERTATEYALDPALLVAGPNILAVEIHNESRNGGDLSLAAWLVGR